MEPIESASGDNDDGLLDRVLFIFFHFLVIVHRLKAVTSKSQ